MQLLQKPPFLILVYEIQILNYCSIPRIARMQRNPFVRIAGVYRIEIDQLTTTPILR